MRVLAGIFAALIAVTAATSLSAATVKPEKPTLNLAVGTKTLIAYLPLTIAERLGYFKKEGLDVKSATSVVAPKRCRRWSAAARMSCAEPMSTRFSCRPRT